MLNRVIIYDPNWINPYGLELSAVIAASGHKVILWCTENRIQAPPDVELISRLVLGRGAALPILQVLLRRFVEPLVVATSAPRRLPLVIIWTRDPWDAFVFGVRAAFGGKTIFVYHNPGSVRARGGLSGLMERFILKSTTLCVVHSSRLATASGVPKKKIRVAAHPPYRFTTRDAKRRELSTNDSKLIPVVAFLGALRRDKGVGDLVNIAKQINGPWTLRILGPDRLPSTTEAILHMSGVTCEHVGPGAGPSDEQLIDGLKSADVMIAPYRSVTESGSIHMALSLQVPVLAYNSPGVSHIVHERSMAPTPRALGDLLARYLRDPWPTYTVRATRLHEQCVEDWKRILDSSS